MIGMVATLIALTIFFLASAVSGLSGSPVLEHLRIFLLAAFSAVAALWLYDTVKRVNDLPRLSELETLVEERTARLQSIIDSSPIAIIQIDKRGTVELWNTAAEHLFGWKEQEVLGKRLPIVPEDKEREFQRILAYTLNHRQLPSIVTKRQHKNGNVLDVCIWNAPFHPARSLDSSAMVMIADISEQMRMSERLSEAKAEAERANLAKSRFLAHMSHEMRTPLTSILGFADLLHNDTQVPEHDRKYVDAILRNGFSLASLIDDLLDVSKIEAGEMKLDVQPVEIRELLEDVKTSLSIKAEAKEIEFDVVTSDRVPGEVCVDALRLRQILVNVAGNAIKFTDQGRVSIEVDHNGTELVIAVKDTGPGIAENQVHRLFRPFQQAHTGVAAKYGGTGLGLSLSRQLAHLMDGDVYLKRTVLGEGSEFEIRVAAKTVAQDSNRQGKLSRNALPLALRSRRILVADDADDNLALVTHYLEDAGAQVSTASDGREAIQRALRGRFDAILMDIQMPGMDGIAAIEQLRAANYKASVIALTAFALPEERIQLMKAGFAAYVTKPINPKRLIQTVASCMPPLTVVSTDSLPAQ